MKLKLILFVALTLSGQGSEAQFFNAIRNIFGGGGGGGGGFGGGFNLFGGSRFRDDGTQSPVATGKDELFPTDCGRDPGKGTGKLCFPDGQLCANRKFCNLLALKITPQKVRLDRSPSKSFIQFVGVSLVLALHCILG